MVNIMAGGGDPRSHKPTAVPDATTFRATDAAKILVVEDEWLIAMDIEAALEQAGHRVVGVARSADEALGMAEASLPHLVLMDIRLKGSRDGVEAAIEIYRRFGRRCIFLSAHADAATQHRGREANPVCWITKPFSAAQLLEGVSAGLLEVRRS